MKEVRSIKLQLPLHHQVKLQSLKVLTRRTAGEIVTQALELYFRNHPLPSAPWATPVDA